MWVLWGGRDALSAGRLNGETWRWLGASPERRALNGSVPVPANAGRILMRGALQAAGRQAYARFAEITLQFYHENISSIPGTSRSLTSVPRARRRPHTFTFIPNPYGTLLLGRVLNLRKSFLREVTRPRFCTATCSAPTSRSDGARRARVTAVLGGAVGNIRCDAPNDGNARTEMLQDLNIYFRNEGLSKRQVALTGQRTKQ